MSSIIQHELWGVAQKSRSHRYDHSLGVVIIADRDFGDWVLYRFLLTAGFYLYRIKAYAWSSRKQSSIDLEQGS